MNDLGIIDRFTETFSRYIDSGFGLLAGDVAFLTSTLVGIDITLAGLFWALVGEDNIPAQLIRKVLFIGFFALLLNNFKSLADVVFQSFAGLGLKATGITLTAANLMRPGFVASTGFPLRVRCSRRLASSLASPPIYLRMATSAIPRTPA
jgi:type IV secretion system protein TrbL